MLLYTVPWPPQGIYHQPHAEQRRGHEGPQVARVQSGDLEDRRAGRRAAGDRAGGRSVAGARHRRHRFVHVVGATGYDSKTYESIKRFYDTQAWLPKNAVIVNQQAFDALDKPTQAALLKAAADAETRGWKASEEKNGWYLDQLKQKGMNIVKPSAQLTADLRKVGNVMLAEWLQEGGRGRQEDHRRLPRNAVSDAVRGEARSPVRRRRLPGGVFSDRHACDGAARHRRPAAGLSVARHRCLRRLLHGGRAGSSRSRTR